MIKATILSDGAWGTALAMTLCDNGHDVTMWGPFPDYLETMAKERKNSRFLPGVDLPKSLKFEPDMGRAVADSDLVLLAVPTQYLRGTLQKFLPFFQPGKQIIVNVAKGIEVDTWLRVSEITASILGENTRYVAISGPSHAEEVSRKVPTLVVAAGKDAAANIFVQQNFSSPTFRVYTSDDLIGVELGGALKNVIAIAGGAIDGMNLGDNTKAALLTRGIYEMAKLGEALGGKRRTFSGLSGIGDLIVTCSSRHSRNRHVGEELGKGRKLDEILKDMGMVVAEGVPTAEGAYTLARKAGVETPLIDAVYGVLRGQLDPSDAIYRLMTRMPKAE